MAWKDGPRGSLLTYDSGTMWDDGAHNNVMGIAITHDAIGITMINLMYRDGIDGRDTTYGLVHGKTDSRNKNYQKFLLARDEYILQVTAHTSYCVRKIDFDTNKWLISYGAETYDPDCIYDAPVTFGSDFNEKIVGFHGRSGHNLLHTIGVYWAPI